VTDLAERARNRLVDLRGHFSNKFSGSEVLAVVRGSLEERLRGARHLAVWPEGPGQVRDHVPAFALAYLSPDWSPEVQPLASFVEEAGGSRRTYRNGIGIVLPDGTQFDRARAAARLKLATESLIANRAHHGFSAEQADELKEKAATATRDLAAGLDRAYARVVVPVRARAGPDPYELEEVDLRSLLAAGRSLHDRVMEALSHRVFRSLTIDKLISLAGLGPDRPVVDLGELVDWFFSYFDFTKLVDRSAIADTVARGVMEGRLGYATGVTVTDGEATVLDPRLVRLAEMLPVSEIDLSCEAMILTPDLAAGLRRVGELGQDEAPVPGGPLGPAAVEVDSGGALSSPGPPAGSIDSVNDVVLRLRLDSRGLFGLNRALSSLREQSSKLDIDMTVRASAKNETGYDRVRLRNGVIEPLEEGGVSVEQSLGEGFSGRL